MTGRKVVSICVALNPTQLSKIRKMQIRYMLKYDTTLSFSKVLATVITNGLKVTKQKDLKK